MSVLIPDLEVYNYVNAGIEKMAFNHTVNEFYSYEISRHFKNCPDIEEEAKRLTLVWLSLNQNSYNKRYPAEKDEINLCGMYYKTFTKKPLTACQLLKYLNCIEYNIEIKPADEQTKKDLQLLTDVIDDLKGAIIGELPEFKAATWSN